MKLWAMPCRDTQDRWVIVKSSNKMRSTGERNGNLLQYSCLENTMSVWKGKKDMIVEDETPKLEGVQYTTGKEWRIVTDSPNKNEVTGPKHEWHSAGDMPGCESKVRCCTEQYCIGTWNVRSINQSKLDVVKQEMARLTIDMVWISELKWIGMNEFN